MAQSYVAGLYDMAAHGAAVIDDRPILRAL
jgi:hypothetical protein